MSVFKLGFLVNYVSHAVICGFTCAASIIIAFSQVKKLLGLKNIGRHFYEAVVDVPMNIKHTRVSDLVVGLICMVVLHSLKIIKEGLPAVHNFHVYFYVELHLSTTEAS